MTTANGQAPQPPVDIEPLPFLHNLLTFLRSRHPQLWDWFAQGNTRKDDIAAERLELLKSTYRLDRDTHGALNNAAMAVARRLDVQAPLTLYQAQGAIAPNLSLVYIPAEVHIVLHGGVQTLLCEPEWRAALAHEMSHFLFLERFNGDFRVLGELLAALCNDRNADTPHVESQRLFSLYTEILCDRASLDATGDLGSAVGGLVKLTTGIPEVSPDAYLRQAQEILAAGKTKSEGADHPETFIRVRALQLYAEQGRGSDAEVAALIEAKDELERLDILAQDRVAACTRRLIDRVFDEPWMRSEPNLAHARLYFDRYSPPAEPPNDSSLAADLAKGDDKLLDYYAYVLMDFVAADRSRIEPALAWAIALGGQLGLEDRVPRLAAKELKLTKKAIEEAARNRDPLLAAARKEFTVEPRGTADSRRAE